MIQLINYFYNTKFVTQAKNTGPLTCKLTIQKDGEDILVLN